VIRIIFIFIVLCLLGCTNRREVQPAFYHWKSTLALTDTEVDYLNALKIKRLYVKFFDVFWDASLQMPAPTASLVIQRLPEQEIVPCIFITNQTFKQLTDNQIFTLANRVVLKLEELWLQTQDRALREVQFDCDWTGATRERFFQFLQAIQQQRPAWLLSATIRLHQVRDYKQTGVPPVQRGMLMFYNTGDLESWSEDNSILNLRLAEGYLTSDALQRYPMPLDVALPIFAWGVLFREGRMIRLLNNLQTAQLSDTIRFQLLSPQRFEVRQSTFLDGHYLYAGDRLRLESVRAEQLIHSAHLLRSQLKNQNLTVSFYHLDTATIKYFPHEALDAACKAF
jgi:hypothetical protein